MNIFEMILTDFGVVCLIALAAWILCLLTACIFWILMILRNQLMFFCFGAVFTIAGLVAVLVALATCNSVGLHGSVGNIVLIVACLLCALGLAILLYRRDTKKQSPDAEQAIDEAAKSFPRGSEEEISDPGDSAEPEKDSPDSEDASGTEK